MDILKSVFQYAITPSGIIALFFVLGFLLIALGKRIGKYLLLLGIIAYFAFGSSPLSISLLTRLEDRYPPLLDTKGVEDVHTIVLLTGAAWDDPRVPLSSQVGEITVSRLLETIRLFHLIPDVKVLISGGPPDIDGGDIPVSKIVGDLAKAMGIPGERILLETNSTNTYENGVEIKKILGEEPFVLVTSASHLPRAIAVFEKLGLTPIPAPADFKAIREKPYFDTSKVGLLKEMISALPSSNNLGHSERAMHEYVGFIWYWLRGRI
ncbi:MAG: YdcF family protein [Syntrophobacterales bacterium]|nr:MAG: YdcF family protein [Syntrophobacterales bacterium]